MTAKRIPWIYILAVLATAQLGSGCRRDMQDQPKYKGFRPSAFFADGRSVRPLVPGTVARGHLNDDALLYTGKIGENFSPEFPFPVTRAVLERGQERYNIYCSPCHDRVGTGQGMIVQRGYKQPPSFHQDRLRQQPPGYFFHVIGNGFGVMPDYAAQIPVRDRWAIVAYIRALQLSQHAPVAELPPQDQPKLDRAAATTKPQTGSSHE